MIAPGSRAASTEPDLPEQALPEGARVAAREAAFLRLLELLFERPRPGRSDEIRSLAAEAADPRLQDLAQAAVAAGEGLYLAVFGPGGSVSPREVAYCRFADPGRVMAELSGIYTAFAFRPRAEDPIDHVAVETGFAGYLALKEAYALSAGDRQRAEQARAARALFLETHLRPFAAAIRVRLAGAPVPHLEGAAAALAEWAGCPPADVGLASGASPLAAPGAAIGGGAAADPAAALEDDADMACGGCGAEGPAPF